MTPQFPKSGRYEVRQALSQTGQLLAPQHCVHLPGTRCPILTGRASNIIKQPAKHNTSIVYHQKKEGISVGYNRELTLGILGFIFTACFRFGFYADVVTAER
jgi:hypothetical protein